MSSADLGVDAALAAIRAADGEGALRSGIEQALQAVRAAARASAPAGEVAAAWSQALRSGVAAAVRLGRLLDLGDLVLVAPDAPARAMRVLAGLDQPFTTSAARQALATSRRVAIPLLTELDRRGWTRRVDDTHREVVR